MVNEFQDELRSKLRAMPIIDPPSPWRLVATHAVGGLTEIGYAPSTDLLLAVSSQGRGVFDCTTGERIARDSDDVWDDLNETLLTSRGIGPLSDTIVRLAGLHGGGLPMTTTDGWLLEVIPVDWPEYSMFITPPFEPGQHVHDNSIKIAQDGVTSFRAAGFSETGQTFVFATSSDLILYSRYGI
ncbi:MAG TPA: hypothetical protein DDW52_10085 [Planctomycetaceae bacterium]|nr:hypothetical protein [Planctomycetaceae bacterium]